MSEVRSRWRENGQGPEAPSGRDLVRGEETGDRILESAVPPGATLPVAIHDAGVPVDYRAGTAALAAMPDAEFEVRLVAMRRGRERITRIHRELMDPQTDYGVIPGTKQPTLLKPGAEKLCDFYRLAAEFRPEITYGDGLTEPQIRVVTECRLHLGTLDGPVVNTGHGAANNWERRYRYRRGERSCPACSKSGALIKGRAEYGGGWVCYAKKGGCGAKFADDAPGIVDQPVGDVENADPYDLLNTLVKMSEKRSYVDATLRATATSGLYTQDVEDNAAVEPVIHRAQPAPAPAILEALLRVKPASLKEAYELLLAACDAVGIDRSDAWTVRQLMQDTTGRKSSRAEPYTIEEFVACAQALCRTAP
jgi:hypothetical protein